ncbi:MAG: dehydrogenase, partial [Firmicutes bacterium HGW-Firmicutes-21]
MRIIIIGAVAAGTSAAAKARRNDETAEITVYERDSYISYSGCGMPYYIGGEVESSALLTPRNPAFFKSKYNVDIYVLHEVLSINPVNKTVRVKNLATGDIFTDSYDRLVIATGARAVVPPITGADNPHVFTLRNIGDMNRIKDYIKQSSPQNAVIIGTGFIGLEVCENLVRLGIGVTLIERLPQVTPGLDSDMAVYVKEHIEEHGVAVLTDTTVTEITDRAVILSDGNTVKADIVLITAGIRPNSEIAADAG